MEYSDKNEHLNDDPLENTSNADEAKEGPSKDRLKEQKKPAPDPKPDDAPVNQNDPSKSTDPDPKPDDAPVNQNDPSKSTDPDAQTASPSENDKDIIPETERAGIPAEDAAAIGEDEEKNVSPEIGHAKKNEAEQEDESKTEIENIKSSGEDMAGEEPGDGKVDSQDAAAPILKKSDVKADDDSATEKSDLEADDDSATEKSDVKAEDDSTTEKSDMVADDATIEETEKKKEKKERARASEKEVKEEEEKINYELLSKPDLMKLLDDLMNHKTFEELRGMVDEIHEVYQHKVEEEYREKKQNFIADGGLEQDFKPVEDPVDRQMEELIEKYRTLKSEYNKQLEEEKEANLKMKEEILEEFRILMEGQEGFDSTFRKFKQLQKRWFDAGIVPKQNVRDLWNSYNFFVEKFNDYVRINKELRVLDLKKNLDQKVKICEKAEELANEKNISSAFKTLQKYHAQWREIGPVPREDKDAIWARFKAATSNINKAHQHFQSELKDSLVENLQKKEGLCERAEAIAALDLHKHSEWVQKTNELLSIQKEWKTIGYAPKKDNNQIYARFRRACDAFFDRKASFYAKTFEEQKENLEQKISIVEAAEELKESNDWKSTTDKLIDLQKRWKEIGPVPRKESDKLWKRFRTACDYFFNAKSDFFGGKDETYEENMKEKESLVAEMNDFQPPKDRQKLIQALEEFQTRYNEIGFVPVESKDKIRDLFKKAVNKIIDKTAANEDEKILIRYRIRISAILNSPRADNKIRFERDKLLNKLQQLRNDIGVWENNIGFFKQTESSEDTLSEFNEKIEDAHNRIYQLEEKIKIIDELDEEI